MPARTFREDYEPEVCQEEVDVVHIADFFNETWQTFSEQFGVPVHNDVKVNTMLPARQERLAIITSSVTRHHNYPCHKGRTLTHRHPLGWQP